jgi:TonB family protein
VSQDFVRELPRVLHEVKADDQYPLEARRLGLGGQVVLRVGIDRRGVVRAVRVIQRAGHGFDEAATKALWQFKFSPARAHDGQPVDFTITYKYTFQAPE